jgi:hypothetical protein
MKFCQKNSCFLYSVKFKLKDGQPLFSVLWQCSNDNKGSRNILDSGNTQMKISSRYFMYSGNIHMSTRAAAIFWTLVQFKREDSQPQFLDSVVYLNMVAASWSPDINSRQLIDL